jgi:hypothetical protein
VFVTHSEPSSTDALHRRLHEAFGWNAILPEGGGIVVLELRPTDLSRTRRSDLRAQLHDGRLRWSRMRDHLGPLVCAGSVELVDDNVHELLGPDDLACGPHTSTHDTTGSRFKQVNRSRTSPFGSSSSSCAGCQMRLRA